MAWLDLSEEEKNHLASIAKVSRGTLQKRIDGGWSKEQAVSLPPLTATQVAKRASKKSPWRKQSLKEIR